jgi:CBS domain-containing protein
MMERQQITGKVRDVMTPNVVSVQTGDNLATAAQVMRENEIGYLIVLDGEELCGIITDRDIVVRGIAQNRDPQMTEVKEIASQQITTVSPEDEVDDAVQIMRDHAVRRLPVVENGRAVGVVSLGDLALERDPDSALGEISSAPPNR